MLTLIAGGIVALLVGLAILQAQAVRASSAGEVARTLGQGLGLRARVARTRLQASALELVAYDVALDGARGPVLRARELHLRPSLGALLRGRVDLRSLELHGAVLTVRDDDLPPKLRAPADGWPFAALRARDCKLSWQSAALGELVLEHADLALEGDGQTLRVSLSAPAATLASGGRSQALARVSFAGAIDPRQLRVERAALEAQGLRASLREGSFELPLGGGGSAQVELDAELARMAELAGAQGLPALSGRAHAKGALKLGGERIALDGALRLEHARLAGRDLGERVELQLRAGAQGAQLSGALPFAPASAGGMPTSFSAVPRFDAAGLRLDALQVKRGQSELRGHAQLDAQGALVLALAGDAVALEELAPLFGGGLAAARLRGRGHVSITVSGPIAAPEPELALKLDGFAVGDSEFGQLDAALRIASGGRTLSFQRAVLASAERKLSASALRVELGDDGLRSASARFDVAQLPLSDLYRLLGAERDPLLSRLSGSARGSAELEYEHAGDERLTFAFELQQPTLDGYRFDGGRLRGRVSTPDAARGLAAGALALEELALRAGGGAVTLRGAIASGGALDLGVAVQKLPVGRVPWMQKHVPALGGQLAGDGRLSGTSSAPRAELDLQWDEFAVAGERLGKLRLRAELRQRGDGEARALAACSAGRQALASGALQGDGAWLLCGQGLGDRARVDLAIGSGAASPVRGSVQLERFDLAPFLPELQGGARMRGEVDATLQIADAAAGAPSQLSGSLAVRRLLLGQGDLALAASAPFEIAIARGALRAKAVELAAPKAKLTLQPGGSLAQGVQLTVTGKASAGLLTPLLPGVRELYGDMDVKLALALGSARKASGHARLHDAYVQLAGGEFIRKLTGELLLEGERVRVQELRAAFGGGVLSARGTVDLRGARIAGYDLELGADGIAFEPQDRFQVAFDANGRLRWSKDAVPKLQGKVVLHKVVYGRHVQLPEALISFNRGERASQAGHKGARERLQFELDIEHDQPLVIRNNFLDAEVAVKGETRKLRLVGSDQRFGLLGKLEVVRGRVLYRGDEFRITRGEIAFDDAERVAPAFDLRAVADKRKRPDANILFSARGNRDTFDLQIRCDTNGGPEPRPFTCDFDDNKLRCDSFDDLVRLWVCRPDAELSSAP